MRERDFGEFGGLDSCDVLFLVQDVPYDTVEVVVRMGVFVTSWAMY